MATPHPSPRVGGGGGKLRQTLGSSAGLVAGSPKSQPEVPSHCAMAGSRPAPLPRILWPRRQISYVFVAHLFSALNRPCLSCTARNPIHHLCLLCKSRPVTAMPTAPGPSEAVDRERKRARDRVYQRRKRERDRNLITKLRERVKTVEDRLDTPNSPASLNADPGIDRASVTPVDHNQQPLMSTNPRVDVDLSDLTALESDHCTICGRGGQQSSTSVNSALQRYILLTI